MLEQIRILSNLETDKEKLLQIILVGQLNLQTLLRSPEMRQLDQRVSIRYELKPLDGETVAAYVAHRLTIAGGGAAVSVHAEGAASRCTGWSGGIPRLINLICDRALLAGFSVRTNRITPEMVTHAAREPRRAVADGRRPRPGGVASLTRRASLVGGGGGRAPARGAGGRRDGAISISALPTSSVSVARRSLDASPGTRPPNAPSRRARSATSSRESFGRPSTAGCPPTPP